MRLIKKEKIVKSLFNYLLTQSFLISLRVTLLKIMIFNFHLKDRFFALLYIFYLNSLGKYSVGYKYEIEWRNLTFLNLNFADSNFSQFRCA